MSVSVWAKRRNRQIKSGTWAEYLDAAAKKDRR
jgi:hypothetical protein